MKIDEQTIRIPHEKMKSEFLRILLKFGFPHLKAEKCADIFTMNSLDGVNSHGINRFPRFIKNIKEGYVRPDAVPSITHKIGSIEQWNGNLGPGPLNAEFATQRSMELALINGIGIATLSNTNHWMRAGTYGWQAAKKGFVLICWTNTCQNMPAWGASDPRIGNNPMVIAVPFDDDAIVLDFAMSQYSYGKLDTVKKEGRKLPYPGGYNKEGQLSKDPEEILESWRVLPVGYWKGSGLSILLDILAAILSGGFSTHEIEGCNTEHDVSQVFIAINIKMLNNFPSINTTINKIINDLHNSIPIDPGNKIRYPGENVIQLRKENMEKGIPVNKLTWERLLKL
jgi:3-dehydro-L-gulonate 2-dehydrogenase